MKFVIRLRDALVKADWSKIGSYRDPTVVEYGDWGYGNGGTSTNKKYCTNYGSGSEYVSKFDKACATDDDNYDLLYEKHSSLERVVEAFPYEVSQILQEYGYDKGGLIKDILNYHSWMSDTVYR